MFDPGMTNMQGLKIFGARFDRQSLDPMRLHLLAQLSLRVFKNLFPKISKLEAEIYSHDVDGLSSFNIVINAHKL